MMRSLWTAASGMKAQQLNVDTISNNLANVNTTGYKKQRLEFKDMLYETMSKATVDPGNGEGRPVNLQVGHGVRPVATVKSYARGNLQSTGNPLDMALDGNGFFVIQGPTGPVYTRDGAFKVSLNEDGEAKLVTADGYPVLNTDDEEIILPAEVNLSELLVSDDGRLSYVNVDGEMEDLEQQIKIVQFRNSPGLEDIGNNFVKQTTASGAPLIEADGDVTSRTKIVQRFLETSNVQVVDEMVSLIIAQRAYDVNSKSIQTSDQMLEQANNLKR